MKAESSEVKVKLPHRDQKEAAMDAVFVEDEVCTYYMILYCMYVA